MKKSIEKKFDIISKQFAKCRRCDKKVRLNLRAAHICGGNKPRKKPGLYDDK